MYHQYRSIYRRKTDVPQKTSLTLLSRCIVVMIFVISSSIGCFSLLLAIETHFFFAHIVLQWIEISFRGSKWAEQVEKLLRL
jgi:hypothetical protein